MTQKREWIFGGIVSLTSEREWTLVHKWWGLRKAGKFSHCIGREDRRTRAQLQVVG